MREEWSSMLERHHRLVTLLATGNICFSVDQSDAGAVCYSSAQKEDILRAESEPNTTGTISKARLRHLGATRQTHAVLKAAAFGTIWAVLSLWSDERACGDCQCGFKNTVGSFLLLFMVISLLSDCWEMETWRSIFSACICLLWSSYSRCRCLFAVHVLEFGTVMIFGKCAFCDSLARDSWGADYTALDKRTQTLRRVFIWYSLIRQKYNFMHKKYCIEKLATYTD